LPVSITAAEYGFNVTYEGVTALAETLAAFAAAENSPEFRPGCGFLVDGVLSTPPDTGYVSGVLDYLRSRSELNGTRWAVLVGSDAQFGMARMTQMLAEASAPGIRVAVFRDAAAAVGWLRS
jgi:hypothetical protein